MYSESKAFSSVSISFTQDPEYLYPSDCVLYVHPVSRKGMIMLLLLLCQCFVFGVFIRDATVSVILVNPLVTAICFYTHILLDLHATFFKHLKIMCPSLIYVHR